MQTDEQKLNSRLLYHLAGIEANHQHQAGHQLLHIKCSAAGHAAPAIVSWRRGDLNTSECSPKKFCRCSSREGTFVLSVSGGNLLNSQVTKYPRMPNFNQ
jgi:hypothetical protein